MPARRILTSALAAAVTIAISAPAVSAQFTPRFQTRERGEPVQWHVGIGVTAVNMGDYTSETWPELGAPAPIFHGRVGVAIPLKGDELFIMPELEGNTTRTDGVYIHPLNPTRRYNISEIGQRGFSVMLNLVRAWRDRNVLIGAGLGYHLLEHDPTTVPVQITEGWPFHRDPFNHIGIGGQLHYARGIGELAEGRRLMLEARYKVALMSGNVSDRTLLMSEFQVTLYLAIK
jgi:hypothetical protein